MFSARSRSGWPGALDLSRVFDRPPAVLARARKERGLLFERDRHGRADEREAKGVERGDEGLELPSEHAHRERYVESVEAQRLEVRVVEGRREGVRDDASEEPEEPGHLSRPGHAVDLREVAGQELPRRRLATGKKGAVRERRAKIRGERAGGDAGLSHAEGRETPVPVRGLKLEEAAGIAGIVCRRDEFHEPRRRRSHPFDEGAHVGRDALRVMERENFLGRGNAGGLVPAVAAELDVDQFKPGIQSLRKQPLRLPCAAPEGTAFGCGTDRRDECSSF